MAHNRVSMSHDRTSHLPEPTWNLPRPVGYAMPDHPIFLRCCHSPWLWLSQRLLVYIRGFIVVYLTALLVMLAAFKLNREPHPLFVFFQFSSLSFGLLYAYHVLVFCWAITHFYLESHEATDDHWRGRVVRIFSPPVQNPTDNKDLYFSLFYTAVHVFAIITGVVFWAILVSVGDGQLRRVDKGVTWDETVIRFTNEWFQSICTINLYGMSVALVLIEVMLLNSVKRQTPVSGHIYSLMFLLGLYVGWAALGKQLAGRSPCFFLDPNIIGGPLNAAACSVVFVALAPIGFAVMYALIVTREKLTRQGR